MIILAHIKACLNTETTIGLSALTKTAAQSLGPRGLRNLKSYRSKNPFILLRLEKAQNYFVHKLHSTKKDEIKQTFFKFCIRYKFLGFFRL